MSESNTRCSSSPATAEGVDTVRACQSLVGVGGQRQVIFKSTKLLGAMAVGVALLPNKRFSRTEFAAAALPRAQAHGVIGIPNASPKSGFDHGVRSLGCSATVKPPFRIVNPQVYT